MELVIVMFIVIYIVMIISLLLMYLKFLTIIYLCISKNIEFSDSEIKKATKTVTKKLIDDLFKIKHWTLLSWWHLILQM